MSSTFVSVALAQHYYPTAGQRPLPIFCQIPGSFHSVPGRISCFFKTKLTSPLTSLSSLEFVEETPPVSSSALLPSAASFVEDKPFLLDEASKLGNPELVPAANTKPELEPDPPAPNIKQSMKLK